MTNCDLSDRPDRPTPREAKEALMRLHSMTEPQFDALYRLFRDGRMRDVRGVEWYWNPNVPPPQETKP